MAASTSSLTLLRGTTLRCPGCEVTGSVSQHFKRLDKNERYADQLATIYRHRRDRGGCGHVFAPLPYLTLPLNLNGTVFSEEVYTT